MDAFDVKSFHELVDTGWLDALGLCRNGMDETEYGCQKSISNQNCLIWWFSSVITCHKAGGFESHADRASL